MSYEILHRDTQAVLYRSEGAASQRDAVIEAVRKGAHLRGANLRGAYLEGANLEGAHLRGAHLRGANLGSGVMWEDFVKEVTPTLLTAGGKDLAGVAEHWGCCTWDGDIACPIAWAFDAKSLSDVPALHRYNAHLFITFHDGKALECPVSAEVTT